MIKSKLNMKKSLKQVFKVSKRPPKKHLSHVREQIIESSIA